MGKIVNIPTPVNSLHTDESATGRAMALDALIECGPPGNHRDRVAVEHAKVLIDEINDCSKQEAFSFLAGYLSMVFDCAPEFKEQSVKPIKNG